MAMMPSLASAIATVATIGAMPPVVQDPWMRDPVVPVPWIQFELFNGSSTQADVSVVEFDIPSHYSNWWDCLSGSILDKSHVLGRELWALPSANSSAANFVKISHAEAATEMRSYKDLQNGWDGVGSLAPDISAINNALTFLTFLTDKVSPEPTVSADQAVGWVWDEEDTYVSVFFMPKGTMAYFGQLGGQTVARGTIEFDPITVPSDLMNVISQVRG